MARVCQDWYPKGTFPYQKGDGFYMNETLKQQIDYFVQNIESDWDFSIVISGKGAVRVGKCQPKGSKVLMSDGSWKEVQDVKVGDQVISPNSDYSGHEIANVSETDSFYSEDNYAIYKKSTGEKLYECSGNHLVPVSYIRPVRKTENGKRYIKRYERRTKNIKASDLNKCSSEYLKKYSFGIPQGYFIENYSKIDDPEIDPYTLGVFLGDGHLTHEYKDVKNSRYKEYSFVEGYNKTLKSGEQTYVQSFYRKNSNGKPVHQHLNKTLSITSKDEEVIKKVLEKYPCMNTNKKKSQKATGYIFSNSSRLFKELADLGLENKKSADKFIPDSVKKSSSSYRMKLLAGYLDADGFVDKRGVTQITTKSKQLAKDFLYISRSLGGNAEIKEKKKQIKSRNFEGTYYTVQINLGEKQSEIPIQNYLKRSRLRNIRAFKYTQFSIEKTNNQQVYGIVLDNESKLYITDNFCVTHNSYLAFQVGAYWSWSLWQKGYKVPWNVEDNVVFNGKKLIEKGNKLGTKNPHSCIVFDEAGADLEGAKAMKQTTQAVKDYLRECGQYNMLTILVLPEFFDLPKGIAINRTNILLDAYSTADNEGFFRRGLFRFFSKPQKKKLYLFGKRNLDYDASKPDFHGDFPKFLTLGEENYRNAKQQALQKRDDNSVDKKLLQRNISWYLLHHEAKMTMTEIGRRTTQMGAYTTKPIISEALKGLDLEGTGEEDS